MEGNSCSLREMKASAQSAMFLAAWFLLVPPTSLITRNASPTDSTWHDRITGYLYVYANLYIPVYFTFCCQKGYIVFQLCISLKQFTSIWYNFPSYTHTSPIWIVNFESQRTVLYVEMADTLKWYTNSRIQQEFQMCTPWTLRVQVLW